MPEMRFLIRWPDGVAEACYSPSLVIKDYFAPGETYPLPDFVARSRTARRSPTKEANFLGEIPTTRRKRRSSAL